MSHFHYLSDAFFKSVVYNQETLTFFLIGCYPHKYGHHEYPRIVRDTLKKYPGLNINVFLIDPSYDNGYIPNYINDAPVINNMYKKDNLSVMIYPYALIDKEYSREWNQLYQLCYNASHFKCSSIIFNFTGKNKNAFQYHPNIYISPPDCLGDVENDIQYYPVIELINNQPKIFNPEKIHDINAFLSSNNQIPIDKINFCHWKKTYILETIRNTYIKILNIIKMENDALEHGELPVYKKNSRLVYESIKHIIYRSIGKYQYKIEKILDEWMDSNTNELKKYILSKLNNYNIPI